MYVSPLSEALLISELIGISIGAVVDAPDSELSAVVTGGDVSGTENVPSPATLSKIKSLGIGSSDVAGFHIG